MTIERSRPVRMPRGADTPDLEGEMLGVIRAAGLPVPETQYRWARCCPHPKSEHNDMHADRAWCQLCHDDPRLQVIGWGYRHTYDRRRFRADFAWPDRKLLLECQGGVFNRKAHGSVTGVLKDIERGNEAALRGWRVLRVTGPMIADGTALELLERGLA